MRYLAVIEQAQNNYSGYFPDVPGCIATGKTEEECAENLRQALEFHLEGLRLENADIPKPTSTSKIVELAEC